MNPSSSTECSQCSTGAPSNIPADLPLTCLKYQDGKCVGCMELAEIDAAIEGARRALKELLEKREAKATILNQCHDTFTGRLPVEVVTHIFKQTLPDVPSLHTTQVTLRDGFEFRGHIRNLLAFGRVSKRWRSITLGIASLWAYIDIAITERRCAAIENAAARLFNLSQYKPLHLICRVFGTSDDDVFGIARILEQANLHADRLKMLDIDTYCGAMPEIAASLTDAPMPQLKYLRISLTELVRRNRRNYEMPRFTINASPEWLVVGCSLQNVTMRYDKLVRFECNCSMTMPECLQLLRFSPGLEHCSFDLFQEYNRIPAHPFVHANLKSLAFGSRTPRTFWSFFSFPSLTTLRAGRVYQVDLPQLANFLDRSGDVKEFDLTLDYRDNPTRVCEMLDHLPRLSHLKLRSSLRGKLFSEIHKVIACTADAPASVGHNLLAEIVSIDCIDAGVGSSAPPFFDWTGLAHFLATLRLHRPTFRSMCLQDEYFDLEQLDETPFPGKEHIPSVLRAGEGLDFRVVDHDGKNILEAVVAMS